MTAAQPLVLAVAPNGGRWNRNDHANLPLTPTALALTARECLEAGARMIHLHVRDTNERHSLALEFYQPALSAIKHAVGDDMVVQVSSEAVGRYAAPEQINLMRQLMPEALSLALREYVPSEPGLQTALAETFAEFLKHLSAEGCLLQYILYDPEDVRWYQKLIQADVIPSGSHSLLFVVGRYAQQPPEAGNQQQICAVLDGFLRELTSPVPWMVCAFGAASHQVLSRVVDLNGHVRLGFENGWLLPNGKTAQSNAELVKKSWESFRRQGRPLASTLEAREILAGFQPRPDSQ